MIKSEADGITQEEPLETHKRSRTLSPISVTSREPCSVLNEQNM